MTLAMVGPLSKDPLAALCRQNLNVHTHKIAQSFRRREGDDCLLFLMMTKANDCLITVEL